MTGASSSSEETKNKSPKRTRKKKRGQPKVVGEKPSEEIAESPKEKATQRSLGSSKDVPLCTASPQAENTGSISYVSSPPKTNVVTSVAPSPAVSTAPASTTSASPTPAANVVTVAASAAKVATRPATNVATTATPATTATSAPTASSILATAVTTAAIQKDEATAAPENSEVLLISEISSPQKLMDVVKAASATAPPPAPSAVTLRPPLASAATKNNRAPAPAPGPSAAEDTTNLVKAGGLSFAQTVSGTSKGSSSYRSMHQIKCRPITPRPPPAECNRKNCRPGNLQDLWDKRWHTAEHGVLFEQVKGATQSAYLAAVEKVVEDQVFALGTTGQGMVSVYLYNANAANKLLLEGIQIAGRHLVPYPEAVKPRRVVLSRVPMRADNEDILNFLRKFGTVHGKMRAIPIKIGENGLGKGVFSLSREVYMTVKQGCELPSSFIIECDGLKSIVEVTTELRCYACHQLGHLIADCPKKKEKTSIKKAQELMTSQADFPEIIAQKQKKPAQLGSIVKTQSAMGCPQTDHNLTCLPPLPQQSLSSSDEEEEKKKKKKKLKKKKRSTSQEGMPPPPTPTLAANTAGILGAKRRRQEDEIVSPKRRIQGDPAMDTSEISDCETIYSIETGFKSAQSSDESSVSVLSLRGQFEIAPQCSSLTTEQIRSLLKKLYYKKNASLIRETILKYTDDPQKIIPQIELLQNRARGRKDYNEAARLDRVLKKIEGILVNPSLGGPSSL